MNTIGRTREGRVRALCIGAGVVVTLAMALCVPGGVHAVPASASDPETLKRLNAIRALTSPGTDSDSQARYGQLMQEAWQYFTVHKESALPTLRHALAAELKAPHPSDLLLLDVGYFLYLQQDDRELAKRALYALDSQAPMVRANTQELFFFEHAVAADHDARILALIQRSFLGREMSVKLPAQNGSLDAVQMCAFLYGVYGPQSERALTVLLKDQARRKQVLEVLIWVGSPDSDEAVRAVIDSQPDFETFSRAITFLMRMGGPLGRDMVLAVNPSSLDEPNRNFMQQIRGSVEDTSFATLAKRFAAFGGAGRLTDAQVEDDLTLLYRDSGRFGRAAPAAFVNAALPHDVLIARLVAIRTRAYDRIVEESLNNIEILNALVNALRYRED